MTNSNGKIKSGGAAGSKPTPRIRSATSWREGSIVEKSPPPIKADSFYDFKEPGYAAPKGSAEEATAFIGFTVSPQMKLQINRLSRELKISASEWLRRLIEREYMRQSK